MEDDALNRALAVHLLSMLGFAADFASHGAAAVVAAKASAYHLIFMDLQMPVLDGISATRAIRQWEQQVASPSPAKIVAVTSNVTAEDQRQCAEAGMDGFLGKPIDLVRLRAVLSQIGAEPSRS